MSSATRSNGTTDADAPADTGAGTDAGAGGGPWERRWQPLLSQWVIVASTSAARPWSGAMSSGDGERAPVHDPGCYLCPRVVRATGDENPDYRGAFAFDNDFPSLSFEAPAVHADDALARTAPARGRCRVLCWSERHDATLASLDPDELLQATRLWRDEYAMLAADPRIAHVLMFENKGTEIGVSNLHPHGQVYASAFLTDTATRMRDAQAAYARAHGGASLLQDLLARSSAGEALTVERGEHFSTLVPFAARFAYETWIVPHRPMRSLGEASDDELATLGPQYQRQVRRYDLLFERVAPNVTLWHNAPCDGHRDDAHWCFHLAFQPPLRDPVKMKFLAGFESGANNIVNPVRPEDAAATLRDIDVAAWPARFAPADDPATTR